jgi:hypothetical protein
VKEATFSMFESNLGISEIISVKRSYMASKPTRMLAHRILSHIKIPPIIQRMPYDTFKAGPSTGSKYKTPYKMAKDAINFGLNILGNFMKIISFKYQSNNST